MKCIIAGGREVPDSLARRLVKRAIVASGWQDDITMIIHGGARGIDSAAGYMCCKKWPIWTMPVSPDDWKKHGKAAGMIRNGQMAKVADALIAIWNGSSRGTKNMIEQAVNRDLKVFVYEYKLEATE
jgi:hypothetical protein